jgi:L-serine dehydratase
MKKSFPSIFNDVIGPVMRGPSSSHTAASSRIGELLRQSAPKGIKKVVFEFDINGSLVETYHSQGSDIGLVSGLLGIKMIDEGVISSLDIAKQSGLEVVFNILDYGAMHPNNYRASVYDMCDNKHIWEGVSVGGGMVELQKFDDFDISICGDYYELLILINSLKIDIDEISSKVNGLINDYDYITTEIKDNITLINIKASSEINEDVLIKLRAFSNIIEVISIKPILPTMSNANIKVPFISAEEMLNYAKKTDMSLWQLAVCYEASRGNINKKDVFDKMKDIVCIMNNSIKLGLEGTDYKDRILGRQAYKIEEASNANLLVPTSILNNVIKSITAIMEVKSAMGVIVAAPTAGSAGCLPGTILGLGQSLNMDIEDITKGMLAAGIIGVFIAERATFAAEVGGCQVECGAGSCMAAAGVTQMLNGSVAQCVDSASMALQNLTGLACDPVAGRVEVPCLGKNVLGGTNAIASANMALAGYDKVIPLDETIDAMYDVGLKLPCELKCTLGGLGKSITSLEIKKKLK